MFASLDAAAASGAGAAAPAPAPAPATTWNFGSSSGAAGSAVGGMPGDRLRAEVLARRKAGFKVRRTVDQSARRSAMLKRQRSKRDEILARARKLEAVVTGDDDEVELEADEDNDMASDSDGEHTGVAQSQGKRKKKKKKAQNKRTLQYFASQLAYHEWMVDVPADLNGSGSTACEGWYVLPRPSGSRCLVTAAGGVTTQRSRDGELLYTFKSALPGGSRTSNRRGGCCILDCVYCDATATFHIIDVIKWKQLEIAGSDAECRFFWLTGQMSDDKVLDRPLSSEHEYRFVPVPHYECDLPGLEKAYMNKFDFEKDGLIFMNKEWQYEAGVTPLVLVWKDEATSGQTPIKASTTVTLRLGKANALVTEDGVTLGTLPAPTVQQHKLTQGTLLRFRATGATVDDKGAPVVAALELTGKAGKRRQFADVWSKVLAQQGSCPTIQDIVQVARRSVVKAASAHGPVFDASAVTTALAAKQAATDSEMEPPQNATTATVAAAAVAAGGAGGGAGAAGDDAMID